MSVIDLISITHALAVAEQGSFNRAATSLGVRQSVVSRRVRSLEDDIGVSLFERRGNSIHKTFAGSIFLKDTQRILENLEQVAQSARNAGKGQQGEVRIGVQISLTDDFIREIVQRFQAEHPSVSLRFIDIFETDFQRFIHEREIDILFRTLPTSAPSLRQQKLWDRQAYVVLSEDHHLADKNEINWKDIKTERLIARANTASESMVVDHFNQRGWQPQLEAFNLNRDDLFELVSMGLGIMVTGPSPTITSKFKLVLRPLAGQKAKVDFYGLWSDRNDNPAFRRFLSLAQAKAKTFH
jgi:DNA-binding transcriptional LysR family regulator